MKNLITVLIILFVLTGCAAFKKNIVPVREVADVLCGLVAADYTAEQRVGLSPAEWCAIKRNVDPFLDYILEAPKVLSAPNQSSESDQSSTLINGGLGGHAKVAIGYKQHASSLIFETLGSYGRDFGDAGCAYLTDEYVAWSESRNFCIIHGWERLRKAQTNV